ncbi:MAG: hypothetical protein V3V01_05810 [Acidimicrobiales bacterium]
MHKRGALLILVLSIVAAACSTATTREDAIEDLVGEGVDRANAECVLDEFEAAGFVPDDAAGDDVPQDVADALQQAFTDCVTADDIAGVLDGTDLEDVRQEMIDSFTADGVVTEEQAVCILDGIEDQGVTLVQLSQAGLGDGDPALEALIADTAVSCITG